MRRGAALCVVVLASLLLYVTPLVNLAAVNQDNIYEVRADLIKERRPKRQIIELFRLYSELTRENHLERQQAMAKIREIIEKAFSPPIANVTEIPENAGNDTTTAKPPPRFDRNFFLSNLRRNLRGLGRLFMRELRAALSGTTLTKQNSN